jgi:UDP-glucose 4-epimerase
MTWKKLWFKINIVFWPLGRIPKKAARLPGLDRVLGPILWNEEKLDATYVPVGESVEVPPGSALPSAVIEDLVGQASNLFVVDRCACRSASRCTAHPREVGCLFLGEAAADIDPGLGHPVTHEQAMSHVARARGEGLLPCIIHGQFDSSLFKIDYRRMLSICFCCDCCCVFRTDMKKGPEAYRERIIRLPGLLMTTAGECRLCGACAEACPFAAVSLEGDGPVFAEYCKGCGRCADVCPAGNIHITLDPEVDTRDLLLSRIRARTRID